MATLAPETKTVRLARRIAGFLFLPQKADYLSIFGKPLRILVAILIVPLAVLAFPPLVDWLIGAFTGWWPLSSLSAKWNTWDSWMSFGSLCLELGLVLLLGGSVFGQWLTSKSQEVLQVAENKIESAAAQRVDEAGQELVDKVAAYEATLLSTRLWNFPWVAWLLYRNTNAIFRLLFKKVPRVNARFLTAKMMVAFPGGLYGFLAFITFWLLVFLKVLTIYHKALAAPS